MPAGDVTHSPAPLGPKDVAEHPLESRCVQRSWTTLAGESPVPVTAKGPVSNSRCVAEMRGTKREDAYLDSRMSKDTGCNIK